MTDLANEVDDPYFVSDWLQANWEMIVEPCVGDPPPATLEVYGEGADCNGESSRVFWPDAVPTHEIRCTPVAEQVVERMGDAPVDLKDPRLRFERFVCFRNGWFFDEPPFDCVLLLHDETGFDRPVVVGVEDVSFLASSIS